MKSLGLSKLITLGRIARSHIENLSRIESGPDDLAGYCAVASRYLELLANEQDLYPLFVCGCFLTYNRIFGQYQVKSGHSWLEFDNYIIDITATQFKDTISRSDRNFNQRVYICRTTSPHYVKQFMGFRAKEEAQNWYEEEIDQICQKATNVSLLAK